MPIDREIILDVMITDMIELFARWYDFLSKSADWFLNVLKSVIVCFDEAWSRLLQETEISLLSSRQRVYYFFSKNEKSTYKEYPLDPFIVNGLSLKRLRWLNLSS